MQLEEEEFDIFHLLEDVVDLYHPVAMKKGVDLIFDPCDGSIIKYSQVKGDKGKLKQVLCNLLSNAVKFTDEGHITVRTWALKPTLESSMIKTNQYSVTKRLSCLFNKKNEAHEDLEAAMNSTQQDLNYMDFMFEVDDTGKGIPKENYKSVFENYVQVKYTQGGTGLGLGIVQSLVRLMHGDIGIMDKDIGEKGTCFRFNVLLTLFESETVNDASAREYLQQGSGDKTQASVRTIHTTSSASSIFSVSPRLHMCSSSPRPEASRVVLLIGDEERRRTCQRFMESLGIKVKVVKHWKNLSNTLEKIKQKCYRYNGQSSSDSSSLSSRSTPHNSSAKARGVPLSSMDGIEYLPSVFKKTEIGVAPGFILIVIDANAGPFSELDMIVSNFKKNISNPCKVVWLDKPLMRSINLETHNQDDIISKPFHGSRLFQVIKLLPEYGGTWKTNLSKAQRERTPDIAGSTCSRDSSLSRYHSPQLMDRSQVSPPDESPCPSVEQVCKGTQKSYGGKSIVNQGEMQECGDSSNDNQPLRGKKFLVVEDTKALRHLALFKLKSLGAATEECDNGEKAVQLVKKGLAKPPYDCILMDCQMPVMDGFEATRQIREMEKTYSVHIPIIALSADKITTETGMDFHLVKPFDREDLIEAIRYIQRKELCASKS